MLYLEDFYVGDVLLGTSPYKFMKFVCKKTDKDIPVFVECQVREGGRQFRWWWNGSWIAIPDNNIFDTGISKDFKHTEFLESFYAFSFSGHAFGGFESYKSKDAVRGTAQRGIIPKNSYIWYCGEHYLSDRLLVYFNNVSTMSLDEAIEHCKEKSCGNNACALEHKQLEKWLTELKELKGQKPWSEEDGKYINFLINIIRNQIRDSKYSFGYGDNVKYVTKEEIVDIIKSLKPQSHWKPSDEQMKALEKTLKYFQMLNAFGETIDGLKELEEQLKKLKGE